MKKITLFFTLLLLTALSWQGNAQLTEDFEAGMTNLQNATGNTADFTVETTIIHGGAQSVKNVYTTSDTNVLEQTVAMDLSATNNPILDFWHIAKTEGGWDKCYVEISTDGGTTYVAFPAASYLGGAGDYGTRVYFHEDSYTDWGTTDVPADNAWWKKESFNLSAYKVANVKIRFRLTSDTSVSRDGWYIDDITVTDPACTAPNAQTVANITNAAAELGWTDNAGAALWDVEVVASGATASGTPTDTGVLNPFTKTGLMANTAYDYYVRADCSGSVSDWTGPFTFSTLCDTFVAPYTEDFEDGGTIDNCWAMTGGEDWLFANTGTGNHIGNAGTLSGTTASGGYFAWIDDSLVSPNDATLTSPFIDVSGLTTPSLYFYLISNNEGQASATLNVEVYTGTAWAPVGTFTGNTPAGWEQKIIDLSGLTFTGDMQVRFIVMGSTDFYDDIAIDDVSVKEAPTCLVPSDFVVSNETTTTVDLAWTDNAGTTNYEYVAQVMGGGVPTGAGTAISTNPATISGLLASTEYDIYLRADCGGSDFSDWVLASTTTLCSPFGSFTENFDTTPTGDVTLCWSSIVNSTSTSAAVEVQGFSSNSAPNNMRLANGNDTAAELFLITPQLTDLPLDTHRLKFSVSGGSSNGDDYGMLIGTMTDPTDATTFTPIAGIPAPAGYVEHIVPFTGSTTNQYIAFRHAVSATFQTIRIDDVVWEPIPSCVDPTDIVLSGITASDVTIAWTENNTVPATAWEYVVQAAGTGEPTAAGTATSTNPVTDMTLVEQTDYEVFVRAACSSTDFSPWVGPVTFTTPCDVMTPDYIQDFTTFVPTCWNEANSGNATTGPADLGSGRWGSGNFANTGTNTGVKINLYFNNTSDWILSPSFDLSAGGYEILLDVAVTNWNSPAADAMGSDDEVQLLYTEDAGTTWNNLATWNVGNQPATAGETFQMALTSTGTNVQFAILASDGAVDDTEDYDFHIDNFKVRIPPTCPEATSLAATNFVGTNADLSWDAITEATTGYNWEIQLQGTAQGDAAVVEYGSVTTNAATAITLVNDTDYTLYVQSDCGTGTALYASYDFTFHVPIPGETCADPIVIDATALPYTTSDDTANYGDNYDNGDSTCSSWYLSGDDVVYSFTPVNTGSYDIVMSNVGATYSGMHVMDDCLTGTENCVGFAGNSGTADRELNALSLTAGTTYYIVISTWAQPQSVSYDLTITENSCTNATVTYTVVADCGNNQYSIDVEITDMGTATNITISDDQASATQSATATGVHTFGPYPSGIAVDITVTDDNDATCVQNNVTTFNCPPANNLCADAQALTIGSVFADGEVVSSNFGALDSAELVPGCANYQGGDVWFSAVVPSDGILTFEVNTETGGPTDTGGAVYSGTCGALTLVACNDSSSANGDHPLININDTALAGQTLYFRVWEYGNNVFGDFKVSAYNPNAASTADLQAVGFNYYPNPVTNELTMTANENISSISIYNMLGQEVKSSTPSTLETKIDMTNLANGTYFVKAQVGNSVGTFKVIKK